ncbi:hypothetical protein ACGFY9_19800 [Streptomyces sp. NPDC048504]|uniref:hypothetical protein n=2 Tax=unclassified Streptomyces TaxID=2593676 RepID=UPI0037141CF3
MALQPVEATLIVGTASVLASTSAVLVTHRLTRNRERQHRVWDRRMDTYKEALRVRRVLAQHRADVLHAKSAKAALLDAEGEFKAFMLMQAQLEMFGSPAIRALDTLSLAAFNHWNRALSEWRELHARATAHHSNADMWAAADEKWAEVEDFAKTVDLADRQLADAVRDEAAFKTRSRTPWWSRVKTQLLRSGAWRRSVEGGTVRPPSA